MEEIVPNTLVQLGGYGVVGLCLALIALVGLIGWFFYKFASNHTEHTNSAFDRNTEALAKLCTIIELKLK